MEIKIEKIAAIILAAGKGVRMESDLPKVLHPLKGKPLILHVIDSLSSAGISDITAIIGYQGEKVIQVLGKRARCVWQYQQMGTGHAVMQAEREYENFTGRIIIACGDVPLVKPETFISLINASSDESVKAVVLTMKLENPAGYGRILKDGQGNFVRIVEDKDATSEQKLINEVNTGTYIFDDRFLFDGLKLINTNNAQGEYYLPDALLHVLKMGYQVKTIQLENAIEGSGVNTTKELGALEIFLGA